MDSVDLGAGFEGVDLARIVLSIVFLTAPGVAAAIGLKRFRTARPAPPPPRQEKSAKGGKGSKQANAQEGKPRKRRKRSLGQMIASVLTVAALLVAGLGLVPLVKAIYGAVDQQYEYGAAVVGLIALVLLLAKGIAMTRDLRDGKIDHPMLWLAPVPLLAMLVWAMPVVWGQITDQAGQTAEMVFGGSEDSGKGDKPKKAKDKKKADESRGGTSSDE
jgi:hypothetical protein